MNLVSMPVGLLGANCYILYDKLDGDAIVIDPGGDGESILAEIEKKELTVRYILVTHGHFDHIGAVKFIKEKTGGLIAIHKLDAENLIDTHKNLSSYMGFESIQAKADLLLEHGNVIEFGGMRCKILHTPGHSEGSISILTSGAVFTGDTLFKGSIGRTDILGGDSKQILRSIAGRLLVLDDETIVYPGHGEKTTIGYEKATNPFLEGLI